MLKTLEWVGKFTQADSPLSARQQTIAERVIKEISERLSFLVNVGLDYLALGAFYLALDDEKIRRFTEEREVRKIIVVPGKLVNIVV